MTTLLEAPPAADAPPQNTDIDQLPLGATPLGGGVAFRVWAPHAESVAAVGDFNGWDGHADPLARGEGGVWSGLVEEARAGDEYQYRIRYEGETFDRVDPHARDVTNSAGNGIVVDRRPAGDDGFRMDSLNELVVYELHVGTFHRPGGCDLGTFETAIEKLDHLVELGVNAVEVMPLAEFAGDLSWGYNPAHPFAIESAYGGPEGYRRFVAACHERGIGVIQDVVFNHFGPSDLDLWRFDGWGEGDGGGIYFYNDWRGETPWGKTRPDYGRQEVRDYILDNVRMWAEEYGVDGLRLDMTLYMRHVNGDGDPGKTLHDGVEMGRQINALCRSFAKPLITIAEDLRSEDFMTRAIDRGGVGFTAQWSQGFVHPVRAMMESPADEDRPPAKLREIVLGSYNGDPYQRVLYTESHDETANGKTRLPSEINEDNAAGQYAVRRSCLGAALTLLSPGVPMLLQGQEFLTAKWFSDTHPLRWERADRFGGVVRYYRDLIRLRRNWDNASQGLRTSRVSVLHEDASVLAWHRWDHGGPGDDVVVVVNLHAAPRSLDLRMPRPGRWSLRFNGDAKTYGDQFGGHDAWDAETGHDGTARVEVGGYTALVYVFAD